MQSKYMYLARMERRCLFSVFYKKVTLFGQSFFFWMAIILSFFSEIVVAEEFGAKIKSTTSEKALTTIEFKREYLKYIIDQQERLVSSLIENPLMTVYLSTKTKQSKENLAQLFLTVSEVNDHYMQVRFIDVSGQEQIRVDQFKNEADSIFIKEDNLQNKSDRDYFKQTKKMSSGSLWHSAFDLNREQGVIEEPINPTFRVASPVYFDGKFSGIVIINLEMGPIINYLTDSSDFHIYLVDMNNEFLAHPDPNKSWSKYLPERAQYQKTKSRNDDVYTRSLEDIFKNSEGIRIILKPIKADASSVSAKK
jgi:hypothetical protein